MPAQLTTKAQVNGYLFLLQRFDHALVRRDVRMLHDPMRIQCRSWITGFVLAVLVAGGCAVLGFLHPQGQVGDSRIIMDSDSGALYVMVDKTLHPVLNLASARLVAGSGAAPASVAETKLSDIPRGSLLGIPGAPATLPGPSSDRSAWTLCDDAGSGLTATVLDGNPQLGPQLRRATAGEALLATQGGASYLVYDGRHARVDTANAAIESALHLRGTAPRPMGTGLLNATVPAPDLAVPAIPNAGAPSAVRSAPVGTVISVEGAEPGSATLYVALADGIQTVSPFTAEVLRTANSMGRNEMTRVAPDAIRGIPVVHTLPIDQFPDQRPTIVSADAAPIACAAWARGPHDPAAQLRVLIGTQLPLPDGAQPLHLVGGGKGAMADAAFVPPSTGEFVQVTGVEPDSTRRDGLYYITDTGVRFGIPDAATATVLGLSPPKLAPWQIIDQLPSGPMLDRHSALVARDTVPVDGPAR
ncbi:type VII secretion protein EccB [Nocardia sp. NEAU-G5]|uniref:Type VII secretion protein EccB n=1 Tax=Nocardia albiluteola TaxID=2842303 RepID=A0ABS6BCQ1_9NOCA|nr:type VII secretion protein EccB [Nocardia albiluteola]